MTFTHCMWYHIYSMMSLSLYLWHHAPVFVTSHLFCIWQRNHHTHYIWYYIHFNLCHHSHCLNDITATVCMTSYALYTSHPLFMTSHHCSYDITCTVFMSSNPIYIYDITPLYMTSHPLYICHRSSPCIQDITPNMFITSYPLYVISHRLC